MPDVRRTRSHIPGRRPAARSGAFCLVVAAALLSLAASAPWAHSPPAADATAPFDATQLPFRSLQFKAKKLMLTATAQVDAHMLRRPAAARALAREASDADWGDDSPLEAEGRTLRLDVQSGFLGRSSTSRVWLDPGTAIAKQRVQLETGKRRRRKSYRFGSRSVVSTRVVPSKDQPGEQDPRVWKDLTRTTIPLPPSSRDVTDPAALFLMLTTATDAWRAQPQTIHTFSKNAVHRVEVVPRGPGRTRARYTLTDAEGTREIVGMRDTFVFALRPLPGEDGSAGEMQLLGLEGEIEFAVDTETGLPVQISGRIPPVGQVHIRLQSAGR